MLVAPDAMCFNFDDLCFYKENFEMSWSFTVSIITTLTCEHVTRPGNLRTLSLPPVNMVPVPWVFDDFWGSAYRTVLGTEVQKFMHLSVSIKNCEDVLVRVPTYFFVHGVDEESEVRKKKKPKFNNYPGTILRIFPGKARNFLCKGLDIELMKNQGSPCQVNLRAPLHSS